MLSTIHFAILAVCGYLLFRLYKDYRYRQRAKELGCAPPHIQRNKLPLGIDSLKRLRQADKEFRVPDAYLEEFKEEGYHTFQSSVLGVPFFQTDEPKNIQAILASQFKDFELGELRRNNFLPLLGHGIFTDDGASWSHSRAMLRPQFARDQVSDLELEEAHVQTMLQLLRTNSSGWTEEIDMMPVFFRLTMDSATEFLFGESTYSQNEAVVSMKGGNPNLRWPKLAKSFDDGISFLGIRARLTDFYWLYNPKEFREDIRNVHEFADHYVQKAVTRVQLEKAGGDDLARDSKPKYVFLDELAKTTQDPVALRSQLINILVAGRDTTAGTLSWTIWLLARHPRVYQKLREEILDAFGSFEDTSRITFANLKACTYLQYVMNEVLRLYPAVPLNARRATKDTTLPLGGGPDGQSKVFIKKGQEVGYYVYLMHRRKDLWGDDAEYFVPERWEGRRPGWEWLPFNGGPRICLGQQFALTEMGYVLTRLVQKFDDIKTSDERMRPRHRYGLTNAPVDCFVRFHEAGRE